MWKALTVAVGDGAVAEFEEAAQMEKSLCVILEVGMRTGGRAG